jgi:hypothetical protein
MKGPVDLNAYAVPFEKLLRVCSQDLFPFERTTDIEPLKEFIGQQARNIFRNLLFYGGWLNN